MLAYLVRAVTPGEFTYPALVAEDMYEPETAGRTAIGKLTVSAGSPSPRPFPASGAREERANPLALLGRREGPAKREGEGPRADGLCAVSPCAWRR